MNDDPPPRVISRAVWLLLAFGLACVVAGGLVAWVGPQLFGPRP